MVEPGFMCLHILESRRHPTSVTIRPMGMYTKRMRMIEMSSRRLSFTTGVINGSIDTTTNVQENTTKNMIILRDSKGQHNSVRVWGNYSSDRDIDARRKRQPFVRGCRSIGNNNARTHAVAGSHAEDGHTSLVPCTLRSLSAMTAQMPPRLVNTKILIQSTASTTSEQKLLPAVAHSECLSQKPRRLSVNGGRLPSRSHANTINAVWMDTNHPVCGNLRM